MGADREAPMVLGSWPELSSGLPEHEVKRSYLENDFRVNPRAGKSQAQKYLGLR